MLGLKKRSAVVLLAMAAGVILVEGQQRPAGPFTAAQASAGRTAYQENCSGCHLADLAGRNEAPPLAGGNFMNTWGGRSTRELLALIQTTMPPGSPGALGSDVYAEIAAFILQSNGATPGTQPLTANSAVTISSIATGQAPAGGRGAGRGAGGGRGAGDGAAAGGGRGGPRPNAVHGITVAGEVKNYTPVTDEMLLHPDPADWLMIRRNYQASSYSPLAQITSKNVQNLQLVWAWAMNDGGAAEPTPIVHNGIIFLANPNNTVQALDARTGELIWENRIGPESTAAYGATRSLAVYQDKVFVPTTDAKMNALDARTGKIVWSTVIADNRKGYSETGGPLVIHGKVLQGLMGCDRFKEEGCYITPTTPTTANSSGSSTPWRGKANRAAIPGTNFPICCAAAATTGSPAATIRIST